MKVSLFGDALPLSVEGDAIAGFEHDVAGPP